ncbi:DNA-binding response regulator [Methylosinus sp. C49]|uniref:response regulator transcription factor n=1 Tax=Methylosinus sp. C49 TaxID=2699395 RepID=UPI001367392A|nr:response regulator [Methylosinus sp. C49]BBU60934.1 DNA-binding response regulator [Methylosinus sp. C49]
MSAPAVAPGSAIVHVIDDDAAVRDSLRLLLKMEAFDVRAHASAREFFSCLGPGDGGCVVTDVRMPDTSGLELLAEIKVRGLDLPVIVITAHADVSLAVQAMKAGAVDLLEKPFGEETLLRSVRQALGLRGAVDGRGSEAAIARDRLASLTAREREVLVGVLEGRPNKIIAHELGISVRTVEAHRARLMVKMQVRSLSELVRISVLVPRAASF